MSAPSPDGGGRPGSPGFVARLATPSFWGALALLVVVVRHISITDSILGGGLAVIALVACVGVGPRLSLGTFAQRAGTLVAAAAGGLLAWMEGPEVPQAGLGRGWATLSLVALFAATFRMWVRAPRGGFLTTFVLGLAALVACGETIFAGGYGLFVVGYLLLGLVAMRAHDEGRAPIGALPARSWAVTSGLLAVGAAAAVAFAFAIPPLAIRVRDRLLSSLDASVSGLGDRMVLGSLEGMLVSDEIVARVYGPPVDYLRGVVYDHYQAGQWATSSMEGTRILPGGGLGAGAGASGGAGPMAIAAPASAPSAGRVRVVLIGARRGDRYPVPLGARAFSTPDGPIAVDRFGTVRPERGAPVEFSFELTGAPEQADFPPARPAQDDRRMPVKVADSVGPLLKSWIADKTAPEERAAAIADHLRAEFRYSLEYERRSGDPLLEFLHDSREGHCEYFASAMAMLVRRAGIPARVVAGYRVAEYNEIGGYSVVRARNAHAWVEVHIEGKGWQTFDPTPEDLLAQNRPHRTPTLSAILDVVRAWWGTARTRLSEMSLWEIIVFLLAFIAVALIVRWWGRRGQRAGTGLEPFFQAEAPPPALTRLLTALAGAGYTRDPSEPLERFAERLSERRPDTDPRIDTGEVKDILLRYSALRYGGVGQAEALFAEMEELASQLPLSANR